MIKIQDINISYKEIEKNGKKYHRYTLTPLVSDLIHKNGTFQLYCIVETKDDRAVNYEKKIGSQKFTFSKEGPVIIDIPKDRSNLYLYNGRDINIILQVHLHIETERGTEIVKQQHREFTGSTKIPEVKSIQHVIEPYDSVNLFKNLIAIGGQRSFLSLLMLVAIAVLIIGNTMIGIHDQFAPEADAIIYKIDRTSRYGHPILISGGISYLVGFIAMSTFQKQLYKYVTLRFKSGQGKISPNTKYCLKKIITGKSRVTLKNVKFRVIAANFEHGACRRGTGKEKKLVRIQTPLHGFILFEEQVPIIPANTPIEDQLSNKTFTFNRVFEQLYPALMIYDYAGIDLRWEVQMLHNDLVDIELVGDRNIFKQDDFWERVENG